MMARPVVDLPQPDSPTRPSVSPFEDVEADARHGVHLAAPASGELDDEVLDAQQHVVGRTQVGGAGPPCSLAITRPSAAAGDR